MRFIVRHQTSTLEEEVYEFEVIGFIKYVGFWLSKRKSEDDPFGYDWDEFYKEQKFKELDKLDEIYGSSDDIGEYSYDHPKYTARREIIKKYNPVEQRMLRGHYSSTVAEDYPLKVSKEFIIEKAIEHLKSLGEK
jgi:hypothetical protein